MKRFLIKTFVIGFAISAIPQIKPELMFSLLSLILAEIIGLYVVVFCFQRCMESGSNAE